MHIHLAQISLLIRLQYFYFLNWDILQIFVRYQQNSNKNLFFLAVKVRAHFLRPNQDGQK